MTKRTLHEWMTILQPGESVELDLQVFIEACGSDDRRDLWEYLNQITKSGRFEIYYINGAFKLHKVN